MIDYAKMEAEPEIDRLVAEKVMGWFAVEDRSLSYYQWHRAEKESSGYSLPGFHGAFEPSTDIAHAFEVVDRLKAAEIWLMLYVGLGTGWMSKFGISGRLGDHASAGADTAPLAICRAALLAVSAKP